MLSWWYIAAVVVVVLILVLAAGLAAGCWSAKQGFAPRWGGGAPLGPRGFPKSILQTSARNPDWGAIDYAAFEVAPEGFVSTYSSLMPWHVRDVDSALRELFPSPPRSVTDMTAHIGADSANFAKLFPGARVTSVEFDPGVHKVLSRNMRHIAAALGVDKNNFKTVHGSAQHFLRTHDVMSDMVYFDPPWGDDRLNLRLGDVPLPDLIADVISRPGVRFVVAKLPREYDLDALAHAVGVREARRFAVRDARSEKLSYWLVAFAGKLEGRAGADRKR
jgi:hypothetical protein